MSDKCPFCGGKVTGVCRCFRADSTCENGHKWHTCTVHHVQVQGHSDHSTNTSSCTCGACDKTEIDEVAHGPGQPKFTVDPDGISIVRHGFADYPETVIASFSPEEAHDIGMQLIQAAKDDYSRAMEEHS